MRKRNVTNEGKNKSERKRRARFSNSVYDGDRKNFFTIPSEEVAEKQQHVNR